MISEKHDVLYEEMYLLLSKVNQPEFFPSENSSPLAVPMVSHQPSTA